MSANGLFSRRKFNENWRTRCVRNFTRVKLYDRELLFINFYVNVLVLKNLKAKKKILHKLRTMGGSLFWVGH